jgi:hypothetical protein
VAGGTGTAGRSRVARDAVELAYRDRSRALKGRREWVAIRTGAGWRLRSLWSATVWATEGAMEARCQAPFGLVPHWQWSSIQADTPHAFAPDPRCICGLSARHRLRVRRQEVRPRGTRYVQGTVRGWGVLVVGRGFWRAQFAELTGPLAPETRRDAKLVRMLGDAYGVPVADR